MEWFIVLLAFGILFLGELGNKTQLVVFNLSLEHNKPYKVGIGATLGFALIVTISVFFGLMITRFIPLFMITIASGIIFILIGILKARNLRELNRERKQIKSNEDQKTKKTPIEENLSVFDKLILLLLLMIF